MLVPLLLGFFSIGSQDEYPYADDGTGVELPMGGRVAMGGDEPGSVYGVWVDSRQVDGHDPNRPRPLGEPQA